MVLRITLDKTENVLFKGAKGRNYNAQRVYDKLKKEYKGVAIFKTINEDSKTKLIAESGEDSEEFYPHIEFDEVKNWIEVVTSTEEKHEDDEDRVRRREMEKIKQKIRELEKQIKKQEKTDTTKSVSEKIDELKQQARIEEKPEFNTE